MKVFGITVNFVSDFTELKELIMASKQEAIDAINSLKTKVTEEHQQVLAAVQALKDSIANRPEVPDDVIAAINTLGTDIEGIFTPDAEEPSPEIPT